MQYFSIKRQSKHCINNFDQTCRYHNSMMVIST